MQLNIPYMEHMGGAFLPPFITIVNMPNLKDGSQDRIKHIGGRFVFFP